jgi:hypothetical protein
MLDEAHRKLALRVLARAEAAGMSPRPPGRRRVKDWRR